MQSDRSAISNSRLVELVVKTANRSASAALRALAKSLPYSISVFGRSAGKMIRAAQEYERQRSEIEKYTADTLRHHGVKGVKVDPIIIDEVIRLNLTVDALTAYQQLTDVSDLRGVLDSHESKPADRGVSSGGRSGPKRNAIQRGKAALMAFRTFIAGKAGGRRRDQKWRRL